ncbi:MAG TPA: 4-(cytidine 5'-diphospho)-2-C-methyl-D-erythritol kinase [Alphaproteobacteria bacterium]|nr:4-(cytidine 5'-diphospho)-2-C-methyl-D-erythritol kinase [Alphaproteobacteria bacterium]
MITETAPAKINLYLHVTGRRDDGYHLLDSLVVFAPAAADRITLVPAEAYALHIEGHEAIGLNREDPEKNLITKALRTLSAKTGKPLNFAITLQKNLPLASGIGGGSADAAAALRAAAQFWNLSPDHPALLQAALETGADVPACLRNTPCYFGGIGDEITPVENLPRFFLVLLNPRIPLPTPSVFKARQGDFHPPARLTPMPQSAQELAALLKQRHNDLQEAACQLCEAVGDCLSMLEEAEGCLLARMSGSGATCFGLFADEKTAEAAAAKIRRQIQEYWVAVSAV